MIIVIKAGYCEDLMVLLPCFLILCYSCCYFDSAFDLMLICKIGFYCGVPLELLSDTFEHNDTFCNCV